MQPLSVRECLSFGWHTFIKRPWFFIGVVILVVVVSSVLTSIADAYQTGALSLLLVLVVLAVNILIEMGLVSFALKAHEDVEKATLHDLWHPTSFWKYVGAKILVALVVLVGLVLLIIPGIIAALALLFSTYLVIDRGLGPIEAMKESLRITKGNRWKLFLLALSIVLINIIGVLALIVGLLVSIPVSVFAVVHAYRMLEHQASEVVAAPAPATA
ncbi:MAG: DUF975 family protein [Patescibacteria group bacterium]